MKIFVLILLIITLGVMIISVFSGVAYDIIEVPSTGTNVTGNATKATAATTYPSHFITPQSTFSSGYVYYTYREGTPGYITVDGITYFYMKYYIPPVMETLRVSGKGYGVYQNVFRYTITDLNNWYLCSDYLPISVYDDKYHLGLDTKYDKVICISYCAIQNCSDPSSVFQDLIDNVFSNTEYYDVCFDSLPKRILGDSTMQGAN